jgi:hypothetical protein
MCYFTIAGSNVQCTTYHPISSQTEPTAYYVLTIRMGGDSKLAKNVRLHRAERCRYKIELDTVCGYLHQKLQHCTQEVKKYSRERIYQVKCNYEWLVSIIDCEIDYHFGRRRCVRGHNKKYMIEYQATQLSGFGEKFYDAENNISASIVAQMYKMEASCK